jgi:hypothetical protein
VSEHGGVNFGATLALKHTGDICWAIINVGRHTCKRIIFHHTCTALLGAVESSSVIIATISDIPELIIATSLDEPRPFASIYTSFIT